MNEKYTSIQLTSIVKDDNIELSILWLGKTTPGQSRILIWLSILISFIFLCKICKICKICETKN